MHRWKGSFRKTFSRKRWNILKSGRVMENAPRHKLIMVTKFFIGICIQTAPSPCHNSDLTSCVFFCWLRNWMTGLKDAVFKMFGDNWAVTSDLNKLPSELYSGVSERWLEHCNKSIGSRGCYFEINWSFDSIWAKLMSLVKKSHNLLTARCT